MVELVYGDDGQVAEIVEYDERGKVVMRTYAAQPIVDNRSFFADCPRDELGHCLPSDGAAVATPKELKAAQTKAQAKFAAAPQPTAEEAEAAGRKMDEMGADRYEANIRGNTSQRESSRRRLLEEFGDGKTCPCIYCGLKLDDSTVTRDKMYTARQGGKYKQSNLVPSCLPCNKSRGDVPFEEVRWQKRKG